MSEGDNGQLYIIFFSWDSEFYRRVRHDIEAGRILDYGSQDIPENDASIAAAFNQAVYPPNINPYDNANSGDESTGSNNREHQPRCGRSPYCSRASDCSADRGGGALSGCKCITAKFRRDYWSSTCQIPDAGAISSAGRGLLQAGNHSSSAAPVDHTGNLLPFLNNITCPCNCTYVSHACCTSELGFVYEPPQHHLGSLVPPSANLTCDLETGGWIVMKPNTLPVR